MPDNSEGRSRYERLFKGALRIRLVEERIIALYPSDRIQSPVHLSIGQEAVAVGLCEPLASSDLLFCSYRSHAFYMAKGGDLKKMFAELYGRTTGISAGKAGSMHLAAPEVGLMGASAVVASTIPHAAGAALAAKLRKTGQIIVCAFGDGATEEGVYHETLNFVALHRLPVLLVCENNQLAVHTSLRERQAYEIGRHAAAYGLEVSSIANGYDPVEVADHVGALCTAMRDDRRPRFVEISTRRYKEHVGPGEDLDVGYRSRADIEAWKEKDPLLLDRALVAKFSPEVEREIDAAVEFAEASPVPGREHLLTHVL
jgi:TPP-dependent pyruvate/acetoin dehydrogenase alpha subunit